mmetsp:Transcript_6194/g.9663  ORF Transcript_6194/g.9663 Transcript_6194/m.9663 type:complete len:194 (+) Transcript_6194:65-646(+)
MSNDLWETIDWGDDANNAGSTSMHRTIPSYCANATFFDRMETAATARLSLSGSSAGSEEHGKPSGRSTLPMNVITFLEMKQRTRKKRNSWFDADWAKLVPLEDEQGELRSSGSSQCKGSNTRAADDPWRRHRRRQSDYAKQKRRVLERHASLEERPLSRSVTKFFLSSVGLGKNSEPASVSNDDELDVPFPCS